MATLTYEIEGRLLTILNRTSRSVGAAGRVVGPGGSKTVKLSSVQGNPSHMDNLNLLLDKGEISLVVDGNPLQEVDAAQLDVPLTGDVQATQEVWNDLVASDDDAIKTSFAAPASDTTYSATDLDGAVGPGEMSPPRNIIITGTTGVGEALDGGTAVVIGEDIDGQLRSENITLSVVGASSSAVDAGVIAFRRVVSVLIPADASGTPGDYEIGFGDVIGLKRPLEQGGLLLETVDNAVPGTAGTIVLSGTSAPNGTYSPDSSPNGALDFVIVYVPD